MKYVLYYRKFYFKFKKYKISIFFTHIRFDSCIFGDDYGKPRIEYDTNGRSGRSGARHRHGFNAEGRFSTKILYPIACKRWYYLFSALSGTLWPT